MSSNYFSSFTITYDSLNEKFNFDYVFQLDVSPPFDPYLQFYVVVSDFYFINGPFETIGNIPSTYTSTLSADKLNQSFIFTQGCSVYATASEQYTGVTSETVRKTFQIANDANNIYLGSNISLVNIITNTSNYKSIILPSTANLQYSQYFFKVLDTSGAIFTVCPYMKNTTYPIATTGLVNDAASNVYDSQINGFYQNNSLAGAQLNSYALMNTLSNWQYTNYYPFDYFTFLPVSSTATATNYYSDSSNSQCLYINYSTTTTSSSILLGTPNQTFPRFIILRNNSGSNSIEFRIYGALDSKMESNVTPSGEYPFIYTTLNDNQMRIIGLIYRKTNNTYYILSDDIDNNIGLASNPYPESPITLSNTVGVIGDENKNIRLIEPIQQPGFARFNTIIFKGGTGSPRTINLASAYSTISSVIITPTGLFSNVTLDNFGFPNSFTFTTFYQNESNISVTLPLYRY